MSVFDTEITLMNLYDKYAFRAGEIERGDMRCVTVQAAVNTGCYDLLINEDVREKLELEIKGEYKAVLQDGTHCVFPQTEDLLIKWHGFEAVLPGVVTSKKGKIHLGKLAMNYMRLIIDERTGELMRDPSPILLCGMAA